ncbi:MAG: CPBP family intramembrane metalloprotease [Planctomycetota bacterium]|jgi:hypothetical protein|nr:MAG: CPBP family intramembrane metalloprotease [Planctomycetota bacterium]
MFPRRYITYVEATRHPWPNFIFLLPIVILYETAVWYCSSHHVDGVRNGADGWLRQNLAVYGVNLIWLPPVFLLCFYAFQSFLRWWSRPHENIETITGMILESGIFGMVLWLVAGIWSKGFLASGVDASSGVSSAWVTYLGAGIYEEAIFRLLGIHLLLLLFPRNIFPSLPLAFFVSSIGFAISHHLGVFGEAFQFDIFVFRALAGLYFCAVYMFRGFGIAVGAHVIYDFIVSV